MDGGDDGDDDDNDSSRDDANDEDEDEDEEDEEEHLAPADSAVVVPTYEPVSSPEGIEPVIPPPSTDITIGARITVRPQAFISLPPEAEVERLLAMTTPSPSPPISLSPPSAGEHLARCTALPAHSSPPPVPSPLLPPSGTMSSPNHLTSGIEDAFSSNFPDFIPASPDYLCKHFMLKKSPIPPPTIIPQSSMLNPQEFFLPKGLLPPKKRGCSSSSTSALPQDFEIGESSRKTSPGTSRGSKWRKI
ncbi:hypothetical protein Tco_0744850 [Tanacetum coccineum]